MKTFIFSPLQVLIEQKHEAQPQFEDSENVSIDETCTPGKEKQVYLMFPQREYVGSVGLYRQLCAVRREASQLKGSAGAETFDRPEMTLQGEERQFSQNESKFLFSFYCGK